MADSGALLVAKRREILSFCQPLVAEFYCRMGGRDERVELLYRPSISGGESGMKQGENVFYNTLKNNRKRDLELGHTSTGPHRDDVVFFLGERPARFYASQGQRRALALALKISSVECIERYRRGPMIFLVDDAFSELDDTRISRLYPLIRGRGQVYLTTPCDGMPASIDIPRFAVGEGTVVAL
jgi:DNA replication and repair protein RecF